MTNSPSLEYRGIEASMQPNDPPVWAGSLKTSPLGEIWTAVSANGLVAIDLWGDRERFTAKVHAQTGSEVVDAPEKTAAVTAQLREYLENKRTNFDIAIDWNILKPFQREVLTVVMAIPFGQTRTYGDIAASLGKPGAMRAVGRANATNPMPIVIPCHRVLGADGRLHGYSAPGGLETKAWLLRLEGSWLI